MTEKSFVTKDALKVNTDRYTADVHPRCTGITHGLFSASLRIIILPTNVAVLVFIVPRRGGSFRGLLLSPFLAYSCMTLTSFN